MKKFISLFVLSLSIILLASCNEPEEHVHSFESSWSSDSSAHWHAASCEHSTERTDVAAHSDNGNDGVCDVCSKSYYTPLVDYTVSWYNENGTLIANQTVTENTVPSRNYAVTDTPEWDYSFDGWSTTPGGEALNALPAVSGNISYYASVSRTKQTYTVTFISNCDESVAAQTIEYGSKANEPEEISYDGYRFIGWYTDSSFTTEVDFDISITENKTYYACWNESVNIKAYLEALLNGYELNPYSYIPEAMRPFYSDNLVSGEDIISDYSSFVNVSEIASHGFGEQWNMVINNIEQSMVFFNVLTVVEGLATTSMVAFNNYIDQNPSDTATFSFESGIYNVTVDFDGETISYVLDYTANLPVLGEQTAQIALTMDVVSGERNTRIQLGDANALSYTVTENSYSFAVKYLGVRRAYLSIEKTDRDVCGHIYEYLTVDGVEIASAADFYISENFTCAVGNKADGLIGFTGTICETYETESGKLLGYEIEETLSSITYNTLWFDLDVISGINSIKYQAATGSDDAKFFVNGRLTEWRNMTVGGFGSKMFSRRFDIEFRTQYFYSYDTESEKYIEIKASVPMMFIQEENYDTFVNDVLAKNSIAVGVNISNSNLAKITESYDTLLPTFKENKEAISSNDIIAIIGDKVSFT